MPTIRPAAVAGLFYPAEARALEGEIRGYLEAAPRHAAAPPKALIVPHAGYVYSGAIAATAYAEIRAACAAIHRVVLLGPAHRVPVHGLALSAADYFETPLGRVPVDAEARAGLAGLPQVAVDDHAHALEHSLEVQLPFLQVLLPEFKFVPLVVGEASPETVSEVLECLWGGPETLIVVSSDLSHYLDYHSAKRRDAATAQAILELREGDLDYDKACGSDPIRGLLVSARRHGLHARQTDLRNSGDTAGTKERVVGYGAYVFENGDTGTRT